MQWDNQIFGAINKVVGNQIPTSVELLADVFIHQNGVDLGATPPNHQAHQAQTTWPQLNPSYHDSSQHVASRASRNY
jgi:hypothetical protein